MWLICRGQAFDEFSNMSGIFKGVQARISQPSSQLWRLEQRRLQLFKTSCKRQAQLVIIPGILRGENSQNIEAFSNTTALSTYGSKKGYRTVGAIVSIFYKRMGWTSSECCRKHFAQLKWQKSKYVQLLFFILEWLLPKFHTLNANFQSEHVLITTLLITWKNVIDIQRSIASLYETWLCSPN